MENWISDYYLPLIFAFLMGVSILLYLILDGYDLGVGILFIDAEDEEKDKMIASIAPFWDANETWLVLAVGILLIAFPLAHGKILTSLYLPSFFMLIGLVLRGVAFDFRAKAESKHKDMWNYIFFLGSLLTTAMQGVMLGLYIMGFEVSLSSILFSSICAFCLVVGYMFVGSAWLIIKTEDKLQQKSIEWAKWSLWGIALGMIVISLVTPLVNERVFEKWFSLPNFIYLSPLPILTLILIIYLYRILYKMPQNMAKYEWVPFAGSVGIFLLGFLGFAYSFFPYIIPDKMTIWEAASSPKSLRFILIGTLLVLPFIISYTIFSYRVFRGKVEDLKYH